MCRVHHSREEARRLRLAHGDHLVGDEAAEHLGGSLGDRSTDLAVDVERIGVAWVDKSAVPLGVDVLQPAGVNARARFRGGPLVDVHLEQRLTAHDSLSLCAHPDIGVALPADLLGQIRPVR